MLREPSEGWRGQPAGKPGREIREMAIETSPHEPVKQWNSKGHQVTLRCFSTSPSFSTSVVLEDDPGGYMLSCRKCVRPCRRACSSGGTVAAGIGCSGGGQKRTSLNIGERA